VVKFQSSSQSRNDLVLCLPQASRYQFFANLIAAFQLEFRTVTIDARASEARYKNVSDQFIAFPNWKRLLLDEHEESRALDRIEELEQLVDFSFSRIILAGERYIGAAYGRGQYDWPETRARREIFADNRLPYRLLLAMFVWAERLLDSSNPLVMISGSSSSPINLVFSVLSESRHIPFFILRPSKVLSKRTFLTQSRMMINDQLPEKYNELLTNPKSSLAYGKTFLRKFRSRPEQVDYIKQNWETARRTGFFEHHRRFFVLGVMALSARLRQSHTLPPKPFLSTLVGYYRRLIRRQSQDRFFCRVALSALRQTRYIYFPLHKEPELALNLQAYFWHDQKNTIARLSSVLPAKYTLLVKEHPLNLGRRSTYFLKNLSALPGVQLIHPNEDSFDYLANADLIVTENGSSGWEGLMLGRPVLCLDNTFYDVLDIANKLSCHKGLNEALLASIHTKQQTGGHIKKLECYIEAEFATTLSDDDPILFQKITTHIRQAVGQKT
jgi:hypothetical protein